MAIARRCEPDSPPLVVRNPKVLGGEPTVQGTRIPVRSIVVNFRRYGDVGQVGQAFRLAAEAVEEALAFYQRNREEIDRLIAENERAAER